MTTTRFKLLLALLTTACASTVCLNAQDVIARSNQSARRGSNSLLDRGTSIFEHEYPAVPNSLGMVTDQVTYGPPAGNVLMRSRTEADGSDTNFYMEASNNWQCEIFKEVFTTAPGSTYLEINYSTQAWIVNGTKQDGVGLICTVSQQVNGQWGPEIPTSGTRWKPYLLRQTNVGESLMAMVSYHGFIPVAPSTPTRITISTKTKFQTLGSVAANTLILRY